MTRHSLFVTTTAQRTDILGAQKSGRLVVPVVTTDVQYLSGTCVMMGIPLEKLDLTIAKIALHTCFDIDTISSGGAIV